MKNSSISKKKTMDYQKQNHYMKNYYNQIDFTTHPNEHKYTKTNTRAPRVSMCFPLSQLIDIKQTSKLALTYHIRVQYHICKQYCTHIQNHPFALSALALIWLAAFGFSTYFLELLNRFCP